MRRVWSTLSKAPLISSCKRDAVPLRTYEACTSSVRRSTAVSVDLRSLLLSCSIERRQCFSAAEASLWATIDSRAFPIVERREIRRYLFRVAY